MVAQAGREARQVCGREVLNRAQLWLNYPHGHGRNVDHYITLLNNSSNNIHAVSNNANPSYSENLEETAEYSDAMVAFQFRGRGSRGGPRGNPRWRGSGRGFTLSRGQFVPGRGRGRPDSQRSYQDCVYCYMEYRNGKNIDFRHPITSCSELARMHGGVNSLEAKFEEEEEMHPSEDTVSSFYNEGSYPDYPQ